MGDQARESSQHKVQKMLVTGEALRPSPAPPAAAAVAAVAAAATATLPF